MVGWWGGDTLLAVGGREMGTTGSGEGSDVPVEQAGARRKVKARYLCVGHLGRALAPPSVAKMERTGNR